MKLTKDYLRKVIKEVLNLEESSNDVIGSMLKTIDKFIYSDDPRVGGRFQELNTDFKDIKAFVDSVKRIGSIKDALGASASLKEQLKNFYNKYKTIMDDQTRTELEDSIRKL